MENKGAAGDEEGGQDESKVVTKKPKENHNEVSIIQPCLEGKEVMLAPNNNLKVLI